MNKLIAKFADKTIEEIKLIIPNPYRAVGENLSFILLNNFSAKIKSKF
ncbi:hypothetical protein SAMN05216324_102407 [Chryseobacterium limigenitum]|uniref:Uncharacterized protein n=1 Tax=Chryseobacterium limigenitum TaxID=1612149 RepID=A0A1K2IGK5_9FLAO|nr:hypothetical protein SAMN05216324_102407 [Chryseobacterium limigenitum]